MNKKIIYTTILTILLFVINIEAQPTNEIRTKLIAKNCYESLMHHNKGVTESAIFVSIQFRSKFPNANSAEFIEALDELAKNSENPIISYKAQLAKLYFKNTELFSNIDVHSIENQQKVFEQIANKINSIMLASKNI